MKWIISVINLSFLIQIVTSHGRMNEPAARNAAWRFGYNIPPNYNDNELNCGGAGQQHSMNGNQLSKKIYLNL